MGGLHAPESQLPAVLQTVVLVAGKSKKGFHVRKMVLLSKVPYFRRFFAKGWPSQDELTFDDIEEFGMALFVRWLETDHLHGPSDFHSFQHYLTLYAMGQRFDQEALCNRGKHDAKHQADIMTNQR